MSRYLALVPAAGTGSRMGQTLPKQYLAVCERPLLYHSIACLCAHPVIERVYVVLAPDDRRFDQYDWHGLRDKLRPLYSGGATRAATVLNGLQRIAGEAAGDDWILVHDAARPCLTPELLDRLIAELREDRVGGLLALPVADTLKRADQEGRVAATEPRDRLWQAQTPQMFRFEVLLRALQTCDPGKATDEAAAVEGLGLRPRLVQSDARNMKVTYEQDLALAATILAMDGKRK